MLHDKNGTPKTSIESIKKVVIGFYKELFTSSRAPIGLGELDMIEQRVDSTMALELGAPFQKEKIIQALKEMHPCKSPGPDGLPAMFYKKYWHLVAEEICTLVLNFLNGGDMPGELNHTFVVLIPKVQKPTEMKDLRPISLCNVSYKLISKVLANRLKKVLPMIIDEHQSAFVLGRLITDNILLSSEIFHFMKHNQAKKRGYMALKLDMSKAYDRIEWDFLRSMMTKMGFLPLWVERIMVCVTSVSYSFLVNGQPTAPMTPQI